MTGVQTCALPISGNKVEIELQKILLTSYVLKFLFSCTQTNTTKVKQSNGIGNKPIVKQFKKKLLALIFDFKTIVFFRYSKIGV